MCRHANLNTRNGTDKIKEIPSFVPALSCMPRDGLLKLEGHQNSFVAVWEKRIQNGAVALWVGRHTGGNSETAFNTKAQRPRAALSCIDSLLTDPL